jgi:hypothetical protein
MDNLAKALVDSLVFIASHPGIDTKPHLKAVVRSLRTASDQEAAALRQAMLEAADEVEVGSAKALTLDSLEEALFGDD